MFLPKGYILAKFNQKSLKSILRKLDNLVIFLWEPLPNYKLMNEENVSRYDENIPLVKI